MRRALPIFVVTVATVLGSLASAAPYFSEDFESVKPSYYLFTNTPIPVGKFNLTNGSVDVLGPGWFDLGLCIAPTQGICVDLAGMMPGTLVSQPFSLPAGKFNATFVLNGTGPIRPLGGDNTASALFTVAADGNTILSQTYVEFFTDTNTFIVPFSLPVGSNNVTLAFESASSPQAGLGRLSLATGLVLDNVSVDLAPQDPVGLPEPATFLSTLLAFGVIGSTLRARLRSR
jgi:hypothetical protein